MVGSKLKIVRGENTGGKKTRERLQQATNDAKIYNSQNKNTSKKRRSQTARNKKTVYKKLEYLLFSKTVVIG